MTFDEYQRATARTDRHDLPHTEVLTMHALGLAGEAGEFVELVKKRVFHGKAWDREAAKKELGDVLWYLARAADHSGFDLSEIAESNIAKLRTRYPDGFSEQASAARVDEG